MRQVALNTHISGTFNIELENLRNSVLTMGGEVEQQLRAGAGEEAARDRVDLRAPGVIPSDITVPALGFVQVPRRIANQNRKLLEGNRPTKPVGD